MKISNIRLGHANNSSSSHSIVIVPDKDLDKIKDKLLDISFGYGWEQFTLASEEEKMKYLISQFYKNVYSELYREYRKKYGKNVEWGTIGIKVEPKVKHIMNSIFRLEEDELEIKDIDHQSNFDLPNRKPSNKNLGYNNINIHMEFAKDLINYIKNNDNYIILGGNDNDGEHPLSYTYECINDNLRYAIEPSYDKEKIVSRKGKDWYTIINRSNGTKIRLSFNNDAEELTKTETPELVDLKITDYCNYGCSYCYQNSTKKGKHADTQYIKNVIDSLDEKGEILELAIGGGEPTSHPDFWEIVKYANNKKINVGMSTRDTNWFVDLKYIEDKEELYEKINSIKSFAFSVDTPNQAMLYGTFVRDAIEEIRENKGIYRFPTKIYFQYVLGSNTLENFEEIVKCLISLNNESGFIRNEFNLTLLGWKNTGRGNSGPLYDNNEWMDIIKKHNKLNVGIDTTALNMYYDKIKEDIKEIDLLGYKEEGKFSMYVDCVEGIMSPSSYDLVNINDFDFDNWVNIFRKY